MKQPCYDGFVSAQYGMRGGLHPSQIPNGALAAAVNMSSRGGILATRPEFTIVNIQPAGASYPEMLKGRFQGAAYCRSGDREFAVYGVSGRVYLFDPVNYLIFDTSTGGAQQTGPLSTSLDPDVQRLYFAVVANTYIVVQDGINRPIIAWIENGLTNCRRAQADEVPTGFAMAYGHGRLFVAQGDKVLGCDITDPRNPSTGLKYLEGPAQADGGILTSPLDSPGAINALFFMPDYTNSVNGTGRLVAFHEHGAASWDVSAPRDEWPAQSIARVETFAHGCASAAGVVQAHARVLLQTWRGIQDLAVMVKEASSAYALTNVEADFAAGAALNDPLFYRWVSGAAYKDWILFTHGGETIPRYDVNGIAYDQIGFRSLAVVDVQHMPGYAGDDNARVCADGFWTINRVVGVCAGIFEQIERLVVFTVDDDGNLSVRMLGVRPHLEYLTGDIVGRVYTRAMGFVYYGADGQPIDAVNYWKIIQSMRLALRVCGPVVIIVYSDTDYCGRPIEITRMLIDGPPDRWVGCGTVRLYAPEKTQATVNPITNKQASHGHVFQLVIDVIGRVEILSLSISADGIAPTNIQGNNVFEPIGDRPAWNVLQGTGGDQ